MTDVKRLLDEATPLPWYQRTNKHPQLDGRPWGWIQNNTGISSFPGHTGITWSGDGQKNAALIVYAVNRLPDYEAAVDALEQCNRALALRPPDPTEVDVATAAARAALARVRGRVPA